MKTSHLKKYQRYKYYHEGWVKQHNIKNGSINFDKSYVQITRISNYKKVNPTDSNTWLYVPYKLFFTCKCPNLKGNGSNHSLKMCRHYQRSQYKKLQSGQILSKNETNYKIKYHRLKQEYKPIDYSIFFSLKLPCPVKTSQGFNDVNKVKHI